MGDGGAERREDWLVLGGALRRRKFVWRRVRQFQAVDESVGESRGERIDSDPRRVIIVDGDVREEEEEEERCLVGELSVGRRDEGESGLRGLAASLTINNLRLSNNLNTYLLLASRRTSILCGLDN